MALAITEKQVHQIAVGCLYLLMGKASIDFPGSTNAAPSYNVTVSLSAGLPLRSGDHVNFPFQVVWHLWERVVTQVLQDKSLWVKGAQAPRRNVELVRLGQWDTLMGNIREVLLAKMREQGYQPSELEQEEATADPDGSGEIVERDPFGTTGSVDDDMTWPEGHLRLTYPTVT